MKWFIITTVLTFGCAMAGDSEGALPDALSGLADKIPGLDTSKVPSAESAEKIFKEKCIKHGGEEAYDKANAAKDDLMECIKAQVNITTLHEEMENAKPTGDLDTVFGKYCAKRPVVLGCVRNFTNALEPCLEEQEKENKEMVLNITESLADFLCHKDGDRIAMFIAEGGLECMQESQDAIQNCANATFGKKIPTDVPDIDNLPLFVIKEEQCNDLTSLQECVVGELEKCKEPTPANIMESLFKFIRRVTPCERLGKKGRLSAADDGKVSSESSRAPLFPSLALVAGAMLLRLA